MPANTNRRHRGAPQSASLMRARNQTNLAPGRASYFRRKCSEYTGQARRQWSLRRPMPAATARRLP